MHYTHNLKSIRHRKHTIKISFVITVVTFILILLLGFTLLDTKQFFLGFLESLYRVVFAYFISLILAIIITLIITSSNKLEEIFIPILDVLQSFPSFALFPLLIIWFGKSSIVTIIILVITMIWPILFTIITAQKQIHSDIIDAAQIFGASKEKYLFYILLPLLFPSIITGSLIGWGEAWEAIIAAEIIINIPGVGTYLAETGRGNQPQMLAVGITILLLLLFLLNKYIWIPLLNLSTKYQTD